MCVLNMKGEKAQQEEIKQSEYRAQAFFPVSPVQDKIGFNPESCVGETSV